MIIKSPQCFMGQVTVITNDTLTSVPVDPTRTMFNFLSRGIVGDTQDVIVDTCDFKQSSGENAIWIDPNTNDDSTFRISHNTFDTGVNLFKEGIENTAYTAIASNGSGGITVTTAVTPAEGEVTSITLANLDTTYQVSGPATNVILNTSFDIENVTFTATDTGTWTTRSLGLDLDFVSITPGDVPLLADPRIVLLDNEGFPDTMNQAEMTSTATAASPLIVGVGTDGVYEPIVDVSPAAGDFVEEDGTENATIDDETGEITNDAKKEVQTRTEFIVTVDASGGPTQNINLALEIDGVIQTKTVVTGDTPLTNNFVGLINYPAGASIKLMRKRDLSTAQTLDAFDIKLLYR